MRAFGSWKSRKNATETQGKHPAVTAARSMAPTAISHAAVAAEAKSLLAADVSARGTSPQRGGRRAAAGMPCGDPTGIRRGSRGGRLCGSRPCRSRRRRSPIAPRGPAAQFARGDMVEIGEEERVASPTIRPMVVAESYRRITPPVRGCQRATTADELSTHPQPHISLGHSRRCGRRP